MNNKTDYLFFGVIITLNILNLFILNNLYKQISSLKKEINHINNDNLSYHIMATTSPYEITYPLDSNIFSEKIVTCKKVLSDDSIGVGKQNYEFEIIDSKKVGVGGGRSEVNCKIQ